MSCLHPTRGRWKQPLGKRSGQWWQWTIFSHIDYIESYHQICGPSVEVSSGRCWDSWQCAKVPQSLDFVNSERAEVSNLLPIDSARFRSKLFFKWDQSTVQESTQLQCWDPGFFKVDPFSWVWHGVPQGVAAWGAPSVRPPTGFTGKGLSWLFDWLYLSFRKKTLPWGNHRKLCPEEIMGNHHTKMHVLLECWSYTFKAAKWTHPDFKQIKGTLNGLEWFKIP